MLLQIVLFDRCMHDYSMEFDCSCFVVEGHGLQMP